MQALGRLLTSIVRSADDSPQSRECAVFAAWNVVAGSGVRRACAPVRLDARQLAVSTVDQTWKAQLERLAPELIFKINSTLGAPMVTRIQFRIDPESVASHNVPAPNPIAFGDPESCARALAPDAESIPDPELRSVFLRAASKCLARTEMEDRR